MQQSVQIHLETVEMIRKKAASASKNADTAMIKTFSSKNPPAEYTIGSDVLVRRFSSKCRKRAWKKSAGKSTRVIKGRVVDRNLEIGTCQVCYFLQYLCTGGKHF